MSGVVFVAAIMSDQNGHNKDSAKQDLELGRWGINYELTAQSAQSRFLELHSF